MTKFLYYSTKFTNVGDEVRLRASRKLPLIG